MNTINIILMCILCVMIGFAIGNVWGKETMKKMFSDLLKKMIEGINLASKAAGEANDSPKKE